MKELPPEVLDEAKRWLQEASEELAAAKALSIHFEIPGRIICLHAHLTVEKAIKALLIYQGILVPRVHDLFDLQGRLTDNKVVTISDDDLEILNPWSIRGRYPADLPDPTSKELDSTLKAAQTIFDEISSYIE